MVFFLRVFAAAFKIYNRSRKNTSTRETSGTRVVVNGTYFTNNYEVLGLAISNDNDYLVRIIYVKQNAVKFRLKWRINLQIEQCFNEFSGTLCMVGTIFYSMDFQTFARQQRRLSGSICPGTT